MSGIVVDLGARPVEVSAVVLVPGQDPAPPPGRGEEFGKASPIALVVIVLLGLATVVLIRSMSKRLKKLPARFGASDEPEATPGADGAQRPAPAAGGGSTPPADPG